MNRIKVKLVGEGTEDDPYTVNLPTWTMVGDVNYQKKECYVVIPDDEMLPSKLKIDQERIRQKYKKKWSNFKASDVEL